MKKNLTVDENRINRRQFVSKGFTCTHMFRWEHNEEPRIYQSIRSVMREVLGVKGHKFTTQDMVKAAERASSINACLYANVFLTHLKKLGRIKTISRGVHRTLK